MPPRTAFQIGFNAGSNQDLGIVIHSFKAGKYERLTDYGEWPVRIPDSRRILCVSDASDPMVSDSVDPPRVTADGRFIYFSRRVTEADMFLVELR